MLSIAGGEPVRRSPFPSWPLFGPEDEEALLEVLHSGRWFLADKIAAFERTFAAFQQAQFGIGVSSGTTALQVALEAVDLQPGDEVIVPAYTFIATASAVVSDIVDIARDVLKGISGRIPPRVLHEEIIEDIRLLPFDQIRTNYYFRFSAVDRPGVLSRISGILGENNISIAAVIQKGRKQGGAVPVVMTTYKARELDVRRAMEDIDRLDVVMGKTMLIRTEDDKL